MTFLLPPGIKGLNLIEFLFLLEFLICFKKSCSTPKFMKIACDFSQQHIFLFKVFCFSKHFVIHITSVFQINLLSKLNTVISVQGDWSCPGNIKQVFFMISPKCCLTKKGLNKWACIAELPPNQSDYPWFSKLILANSPDMSHLPSFSHRSNWNMLLLKKVKGSID